MSSTETFGSLVSSGALELSDGYRTKQSELGTPGVPILRVAEVLDGRITPTFGDHVRRDYEPKFKRKLSCSGDVILTTKGTVGRVARIRPSDPEFVYSPQVCFFRIRDHDRIDPAWLYYWFRSPAFESQARRVQNQTDMAAYINLKDIAAMTIIVPSILDQRAIGAVLGTFDDKIEANRFVAETAEELARTIPMSGEELIPVGSLATVQRKLVPTAFFANKSVEYFSLPAFDATRLPIIESGSEIKSGKYLLAEPSVLISKLNPHIPRVWMAVPAGAVPAITSTEFIGLVPSGGPPVEVLWALCSSVAFSSQLGEMVKGTTGSHQRVAPEDVLAIEVPNPDSLSGDAVKSVTAAVRLARSLRRESTRLATLRNTLLPRLLSGEVHVPNAEDCGKETI